MKEIEVAPFVLGQKPIMIENQHEIHADLFAEVTRYLNLNDVEGSRQILCTPYGGNHEHPAGMAIVINGSPERGSIFIPFERLFIFGLADGRKLIKSDRQGRGRVKCNRLLDALERMGILNKSGGVESGPLFWDERVTIPKPNARYFPFAHPVRIKQGTDLHALAVKVIWSFLGMKQPKSLGLERRDVIVTLCNGAYEYYAWAIVAIEGSPPKGILFIPKIDARVLGAAYNDLRTSQSYSKRAQSVMNSKLTSFANHVEEYYLGLRY